jgi:hypothetical protein
MIKIVVLLVSAILVVAMACGNGTEDSLAVAEDQERKAVMALPGAPAPAATAAPAATRAPLPAMVERDDGRSSVQPLQTAQRKVISSANLSMEVELVQEAIVQVRTIAESMGGFVQQLSSSGGPERQRANMTIRVPQAQFFDALERIEALGTVQSRDLGSEDVSERFIDLEARLKSALREEQSLLSLLERAGKVSDVLAIERELNRVRSEIERVQGQLNFLERRVDLATISMSLSPPRLRIGDPPSAFLGIEVSDVTGTVNDVKGVVSSLGGSLDRVLLSSREGKESAEMSFRVFDRDFTQMMDSLERQGVVKNKEVREGTPSEEGARSNTEEPEAQIDLSLGESEDESNVTLIVAIAAPLGAIFLLASLASGLYAVYRAGRRRGGAL